MDNDTLPGWSLVCTCTTSIRAQLWGISVPTQGEIFACVMGRLAPAPEKCTSTMAPRCRNRGVSVPTQGENFACVMGR